MSPAYNSRNPPPFSCKRNPYLLSTSHLWGFGKAQTQIYIFTRSKTSQNCSRDVSLFHNFSIQHDNNHTLQLLLLFITLHYICWPTQTYQRRHTVYLTHLPNTSPPSRPYHILYAAPSWYLLTRMRSSIGHKRAICLLPLIHFCNTFLM